MTRSNPVFLQILCRELDQGSATNFSQRPIEINESKN